MPWRNGSSMLLAAFLLDLCIGDPVYRLHPVRLIGGFVSAGESVLRRFLKSEYLAGGLLALLLPVFVYAAVWLVTAACYRLHFVLGALVSLFGIYSAISVRDLAEEAREVDRLLEDGEMMRARMRLSRIVGRDTDRLSEPEVRRAAIEAVAESTLDGVVSPIFFAAIGGAPLALAYKTVNTLDSMIGHSNERYAKFGYLAAKQDEFWNWLPARISYFVIVISAFLGGLSTRKAVTAGWRSVREPLSANGAIPEAVFAGALEVQLGGDCRYEGRLVQKPLLGVRGAAVKAGDLKRSIHLMFLCAWAAVAMAVTAQYGAKWILS